MNDMLPSADTAPTCGAYGWGLPCAKSPGHVDAGDDTHAHDKSVSPGEWKGDFNDLSSLQMVKAPQPVAPK